MSCWKSGDLNTLVFELALLQRGRLLLPSQPCLKGGSKSLRVAGRAEVKAKAGSEAPVESISEGFRETCVQLGQIH